MRGSAAGGGYASVRDLRAFSRALTDGHLLTKDQLEVLWKVHTSAWPDRLRAICSALANTSGERWIGHNGGAPGIRPSSSTTPATGLRSSCCQSGPRRDCDSRMVARLGKLR